MSFGMYITFPVEPPAQSGRGILSKAQTYPSSVRFEIGPCLAKDASTGKRLYGYTCTKCGETVANTMQPDIPDKLMYPNAETMKALQAHANSHGPTLLKEVPTLDGTI